MDKRVASLFILILSCIMVLVACAPKDKVSKFPDEVDSTDSLADLYGFTSFDLSIDTQDMKQAIVVKFNTKKDDTSAKYENMIDGEYLNGNKAMKKLNTIFNELSIDPDMDAEDLIKEVAKVFEMADYKSLQLGIQFKGHDKKELMLTK